MRVKVVKFETIVKIPVGWALNNYPQFLNHKIRGGKSKFRQ